MIVDLWLPMYKEIDWSTADRGWMSPAVNLFLCARGASLR